MQTSCTPRCLQFAISSCNRQPHIGSVALNQILFSTLACTSAFRPRQVNNFAGIFVLMAAAFLSPPAQCVAAVRAGHVRVPALSVNVPFVAGSAHLGKKATALNP